jgi:hypothetical protein
MSILFKIRDKVTGDLVYGDANSARGAVSFTSHMRFEATRLTAREAIGLKKEDIVDMTGEPGQEPLDLRPASPQDAMPEAPAQGQANYGGAVAS